MLTVSGVRFNFDDNESLKISDKRKMVSLSRTFRFTLKIQENRTTQFKVKQKTAFDIPISFFLARFFCAFEKIARICTFFLTRFSREFKVKYL